MVGELQPSQVTSLNAVLATLAQTGLADLGCDIADYLPGRLDMGIVDQRLFGRAGEGPADADRLVRRGAEIIAADRCAEALLAGFRIDRQGPFNRIVLTLDPLPVSPAAREQGIDLVPAQ